MVVLVLVLLTVAVGIIFLIRSHPSPPATDAANPDGKSSLVTGGPGVTATLVTSARAVTASNTTPLIGETILASYAQTNLPPENDLTLMSRLMDNFLLLV